MQAILPNTKLNDRILWYDGDSTVTEEFIMNKVSEGKSIDGLFIDKISENVKKYNTLVSQDAEIKIKTEVSAPNLDFNIPQKFLTLDVENYVLHLLREELKQYKEQNIQARNRVSTTLKELELYKKLNLMNVLRTLIFVINTLQDKNIVWGVGRGSCVASYVLYLIGVHDVDSVEYNLDINEFLRY